jgi:hypothetical protein
VFIEKLCLALYYACTKFRHYILASARVVACQYDIMKHMLHRPVLKGRVGKWTYALVEYDLSFKPLRSMKGQVVADFIVEHVIEIDHEVSIVELA